jgi:predicted nucleic acid-binding Zn ribbon protein
LPTYSFRCSCGSTTEAFLRVSELESKRPVCHGPMQTVIQAAYGYVQGECHYVCPVTRKGITSWKQRREIFAEKNLRDGSDWNPEAEFAKAKKRQAKSLALAAGMPEVDKSLPFVV